MKPKVSVSFGSARVPLFLSNPKRRAAAASPPPPLTLFLHTQHIMASTNNEVPFYLKMSQILIGLVAFFYVLYIGQDILLPIIYATVFAILLNPVINFLCSKGMGRVPAILLTLLMAILLTSMLIYFISIQLATFSETFPELKLRFVQMFKDSTSWVSQTFNVRTSKINTWLDQAKEQGLSNSSSMIGQTLSTLGGLFAVVFLLPVYIFMILFYKPLLLDFIGQLFPDEKHEIVHAGNTP